MATFTAVAAHLSLTSLPFVMILRIFSSHREHEPFLRGNSTGLIISNMLKCGCGSQHQIIEQYATEISTEKEISNIKQFKHI